MRLAVDDLSNAAQSLGCDVAAVKAVLDVEADSEGFDQSGRPIILFEPHLFERELNALGVPDEHDLIVKARLAKICSPKWNRTLYAPTPNGRWQQLEMARSINVDAANKATSWGMAQIIGRNYKLCGCATVAEFVSRMSESEGAQIELLCRFIKRSGIDDELRNKLWANFARIYNGPEYWRNNYDRKLAQAYAEHTADPELFWASRSKTKAVSFDSAIGAWRTTVV